MWCWWGSSREAGGMCEEEGGWDGMGYPVGVRRWDLCGFEGGSYLSTLGVQMRCRRPLDMMRRGVIDES